MRNRLCHSFINSLASRFAFIGTVAIAAMLFGACRQTIPSNQRFSTKGTDDDRCGTNAEIWRCDLHETKEGTNVFKEGIWTVDAPCDGGHGTLVKTNWIRFYRDVKGRTITGQPVEHTLRAMIHLWVRIDAAATLSQSYQVLDPNDKGRFALGPFPWTHDRADTYECVEDYATYPDDEYANLGKCCRLPSECK